MKKLWTLPILGLALTSAQIIGSNAPAIAGTLFQAQINVEQEVCSKPAPEPCPTITPPPTKATGFFQAELNETAGTLEYQFQIDGLDLGNLIGSSQTTDTGDDVLKIHIHNAPPGVAGPVVFSPIDLTMNMPPDDDLDIMAPAGIIGGTVTGIWESTEGLTDFLQALKSGELYVNIHSNRFLANGELRGQITRAPEPTAITGLALVSSTGLLLLRRKRTKS
jgi:hypothetical protein